MTRSTQSATDPRRAWRLSIGLAVLAGVALGTGLHAQQQQPARKIRIRLVAADAPQKLVSELQSFAWPGGGPSPEPPVGTKVSQDEPFDGTLWVRGATVDGKFGFERYHEGKYIGRDGQLSIDFKDLGSGEHVIDPGDHRFTIDEQGRISSKDPDISIEGDTVSLKLYRVDVLPVDGQEPGPPKSRLLPQLLSIYVTGRDMAVTPEQKPPLAAAGDNRPFCQTAISHPVTFRSLGVYLPANSVGPGYLLYPSYQAFAVKPGGSVEFTATRVPGIEAQGGRIVIPYYRVSTLLQSKSGLKGAIGSQLIDPAKSTKPVALGPVLGGNFFTAGFDRPSKTFGLKLDDVADLSTLVCLMDNLTADDEAVRLLVLKHRGRQALEAGSTMNVSLEFTENWREFRAADLADGRSLHAFLKELAASKAKGGPVGVLASHVTEDDLRAIAAWQPKDDAPEPDANLKATLVAMLNGGLQDPRLSQRETFAGMTLPAAAQAMLDKGPAADDPEARLLFTRSLLGELFPAAFRPLARRPTVRQPTVRMAYSPLDPHDIAARRWTDFEPVSWKKGMLAYTVPGLPFGAYIFRVMVEDAAAPGVPTSLRAEFPAYVIAAGQKGTAAFVSNKGRDAFVAGEDIRLSLAIRSAAPRDAGPRTVVLRHPGGRSESFPVIDAGGTWWAQPLLLPAEVTRNLKPGAYELSVADLPPGIGQLPFRFDLVGSERASPYLIVKPSKYTGAMNELVSGRPNPTGPMEGTVPVDVDRAVSTLAGLGYNRIDLMTYSTATHDRRNGPRPEAGSLYDPREQLAAADDRLMPPAAVYTPSPRDQILNACVRNKIELSDVLISFNDFHLPRYIDPYVDATRRWITRECLSMRHSPAFAGMMLYDEMYEAGLIGVPDLHTALFPKIRNELAEKALAASPAKIRTDASRTVGRPPAQRDPEAIKRFLDLRRWEMHGWGDFNSRVAAAARDVAPQARFGTYQTSFLYVTTGYGAVVSATDFDCGYSPDVFENLDIAASVHYCDNLSGWVHSSIMVPLLRSGGRPRQVLANIPLVQEGRANWDGQYSRQMAFAMLAQGADGVSQFGLPHDFNDGPNPGTLAGRETTRQLNERILAPFGELVSRSDPGYEKVAIVLTLNQLSLSEFKEVRTSNQAEELWVACWRLGYPAAFLREDAAEKSLDKYRVIFVPGIRFEGELAPQLLDRLQAAINAGCKVVVERGSTLELKGVTRLEDFSLQNYFYGTGYNPANYDDALYRVFSKSQPAVDYLATKLPAWVEPAAKGPFKVGPNWRTSGAINYLVMANFDDPDFSQISAQFMAKPVVMPLTVPAHRGRAAYDLLARKPVPLSAAADGSETSLALDMTRLQGAIVAFLPEPVRELQVDVEQTPDHRRLRVAAALVGASGKPIPGFFPATIRLRDERGEAEQVMHRVLGGSATFEMDLPGGVDAGRCSLEVCENISGQTCVAEVATPALAGPSVRLAPIDAPRMPRPDEVARFLTDTKEAILAVGAGMPELKGLAEDLARKLADKGIRVAVMAETEVGAFPGDAASSDPNANGFRSWRAGEGAIAPELVVDKQLILLTPADGSPRLLGQMARYGFLTEFPQGRAGQSVVQPCIQVAKRAFNPDRDTLCVVANDAAGMRNAVAALLAGLPAPAQPPAAPGFAGKHSVASRAAAAAPTAPEFPGNNEMVAAIELDAAGNLYVTTCGHGDNLFSLDPSGQVRFSRFLPEMHPTRLTVGPDRVLVFTSLGGRLYQVGLDGKPISQMRVGQDLGESSGERAYLPSYATYQYLPREGLLFFADRVLSLDGNVVARWQGKTYADRDVSDRSLNRGLHSLALSPDGTRVAQIESQMYLTKSGRQQNLVPVYDSYLVIRDLQGTLLFEHPEVLQNGKTVSGVVTWEAGAAGPSVDFSDQGGEVLQFDERLQLISRKSSSGGDGPAATLFRFGPRGRIDRDGRSLWFVAGDGRPVCRIAPFDIVPTIAAISPDGKTIAFLDERGLATVVDAAGGNTRAQFSMPESGRILVFSPDSSRLYLGGLRGGVACYDLDGKPLWRTALGPHNKSLATSPPLYDPAFPDLTGKLWKEIRDEPGDIDGLVRFDANRIRNGGCESRDGWQGEQVAYADVGRSGGHSLRVGAAPVSQVVTGFIGDHYTWVLEFHYRRPPGSNASRLLAGMRVESQDSARVGRSFVPTDAWQFARVVTKSGKDPKSLMAGFSADGGEVLVDDVTLRRIRFPSINHLLHQPIYEVEPVVLTNPRFANKYDPFGGLQEEIPNRLLIPFPISGAKTMLESAFLQNGRLNDTTADWYVQPWGRDLKVSIAFREPRWVSMVGLYFNAYDEANATPNFDVHVTDVETKEEFRFAAVRGNRKLFHLVKGKPVRAALITITLENALWKHYTLTEVEAYGPLAGREEAGFIDPAGQNAYMGNFARVDKRPKPFDVATLAVKPIWDERPKWGFPETQIMAAEAEIFTSRALGFGDRRSVAAAEKVLSSGRAGGLGFAPRVTLYSGVLLKLGLDGKLYCIDPYSSRELWSTPLGQRLSSAPVVIGDDIHVADDKGSLCTIDIANGAIMRLVPLSGVARGSLACDGSNVFFITEDGFLQCLPAAADRPAWTVPVAKFSESTPAVDDGIVYAVDAAGTAKAVDVRSGRVIWSTELEQECIGCPVVLEKRIVVGCRDGKLAVLDRGSGGVVWQKHFQDRFYYDPLPLQAVSTKPDDAWQEDVVLHFDGGVAKLTRIEDGASRELIKDAAGKPWGIPGSVLAPISYYDGRLFLVPRNLDHDGLAYTSVYVGVSGGAFIQLGPSPAPAKK